MQTLICQMPHLFHPYLLFPKTLTGSRNQPKKKKRNSQGGGSHEKSFIQLTDPGCTGDPNNHVVLGNPLGDGYFSSTSNTMVASRSTASVGTPKILRKLSLPSNSTQGSFLVPGQEQPSISMSTNVPI